MFRDADIDSIERVKQAIGLRWTEDVDDIEVIVHSSGFGWEAYSTDPAIFCRGRSSKDALDFYRFCLSECA